MALQRQYKYTVSLCVHYYFSPEGKTEWRKQTVEQTSSFSYWQRQRMEPENASWRASGVNTDFSGACND